MSWPANYDTFSGTAAQGTNLLTSPDHSQDHRALGSFAGTAEHIIGLGIGTPANNQIPVGVGGGSSNWQQTWNNGTLGTSTLQSPTVNGQGTNSGTLSGGMYGTATYQGGTAINLTLGTGTANATQYAPVYIQGGVLGSIVAQSTSGVAGATTIINTPSYSGLGLIYGDDGAGNRFSDLIMVAVGVGNVNVVNSMTASGTPGTRTYNQAFSSIRLALSSGTYTVKCLVLAHNN